MIKLKNLLNNDFISRPCIHLYEANSGYTDNAAHKDISEKIYDIWIKILNSAENKDIPAKDLPDGAIKITEDIFSIDLWDSETHAYIEAKIKVFVVADQNEKEVVVLGSAINPNTTPIETQLFINDIFTTNDVLSYKPYIKTCADHEAVHIIKFYQKTYQFSSSKDERKNAKWEFDYYSHPSEIHAYTAQLNSELKLIKQKNTTITFSDALKLSAIWRKYNNKIFKKYPKLKNKMLSKLANYWNTL